MIQETFDAMKAIVEAPDYPLLKDYKRDFYVIDLDFLNRSMTPRARYLWVVREMGTHLIPLGVHRRLTAEGMAALNADQNSRCYIVSSRLVREITREKAKEELRLMKYHVLRESESISHIRKGGKHLATARFSCRWPPGKPREWTAEVGVESAGVASISDDDLVALRQIVENEVIERENLFARVPTSIIDGQNMIELIDQRLQKYRASQLMAA